MLRDKERKCCAPAFCPISIHLQYLFSSRSLYRLIDRLYGVLYVVFNIISVILQWLLNQSMLFFYQYYSYSSQATSCFLSKLSFKNNQLGGRKNPVTITIINPCKEISSGEYHVNSRQFKFNPLPGDIFYTLPNGKSLQTTISDLTKMAESYLNGKMKNCSLQAISPFPTLFSKGLFPRGVKRCHCVGMG